MTLTNLEGTLGTERLRQMWRLRALEERIREGRLADEIVGSVHLDIGQEAVPVAVAEMLGPDDAVFSTYRGHGWALACGVPPVRMFAELLGRETGINGGRGGSAYLTSPEHNFYGENSIVGAGTPIAVGAALAGRFDGTGRVTVTSFGDGAMNQGAVHEAMNFAAAFDLPVVFICENNLWSEMTPIASAVRDSNLFRRATAYGMPGERIDGSDPEVVAEKVGDAFELAREGGGPTLIEAMTARLAPHYIGDTEHYRPAEDRERARARDPIALLTARLRAAGIDRAALDAAEKAARAEMSEAYPEALGAPFADPSSAREHVYA